MGDIFTLLFVLVALSVRYVNLLSSSVISSATRKVDCSSGFSCSNSEVMICCLERWEASSSLFIVSLGRAVSIRYVTIELHSHLFSPLRSSMCAACFGEMTLRCTDSYRKDKALTVIETSDGNCIPDNVFLTAERITVTETSDGIMLVNNVFMTAVRIAITETTDVNYFSSKYHIIEIRIAALCRDPCCESRGFAYSEM